MKTIKKGFWFLLLSLSPLISGYGQMHSSNKMMGVHKAVCVLHPTEGNHVHGIVTFTQMAHGVLVTAEVHGLTPGKHGFHVHEYGDCTAPNGSSTGGHFNPTHMPHGGPMDKRRHEGDMGNIVADASGNAHFKYFDDMMSLSGLRSIIGRSVVIHQGADDLKSQPAGNSGPKVAYGVIGIAKP